jgi:hypothetical protein
MTRSDKEFVLFGKGGQLMPQEEMLEVKKRRSNLSIGIPRETTYRRTGWPWLRKLLPFW